MYNKSAKLTNSSNTIGSGTTNVATITGTATILLSNVITTDSITFEGGLAFASNYGVWGDAFYLKRT